MLSTLKKIIPAPLFKMIEPLYHFMFAMIGAIRFGFPSRQLVVIGITGTKGKTSTAEFLDHILTANGAKTAVLGTLHFKIGEKDTRNMKKMTMPGRFFIQSFLRDAVNAGCTHAIIEMTSEGARQYRQRFIDMDALIFTNLSPEHIERHGSFENYRDAKLSIARTLARSSKHRKLLVVNADDDSAELFLAVQGVISTTYAKHNMHDIVADAKHFSFTWNNNHIEGYLPGLFNAYNALAAATCAHELAIPVQSIAEGIAATKLIRGRAEHINCWQPFPVVVDYAHTPDSLIALYEAFKGYKIIAVLGNTGGGRDTWKRPEMGKIADQYCEHIILSNEDPYDEDPRAIINAMKSAIVIKPCEVILDRREAIKKALELAKDIPYAAVLLTGKGTDPYIMGPNGSKMDWDEATVAREELEKFGYTCSTEKTNA
ncbi:MAG TPA: UDP-N-acetylmuramyl-tripeptide synthetase [Candidatus Paceibacterota bacterium]|nr:UDP-N-acetylmuramyl-tripeptide synthetase [Candidatus Paceibacterota bacterium]